jgi:RNA polymerase sigma factor (TIGR02999 family)
MSNTAFAPGAAEQGRPIAASELLPQVYQELRKLAAHKLANEAPGQTLQATALVHEVWLRVARTDEAQWQNRTHFLATAAEAMRHILIDNARRKQRARHGGALKRADLDHVDVASTADEQTLLRVDEALTKFAAEDPLKAELVELRFFVGLNIPEAAAALGMSESTAKRAWAYARAWLYAELSRAE